MKTIYDYTIKDLETYLLSKNQKKFKAKQIYSWLYRKRINNFEEMTDQKSEFIAELSKEMVIDPLRLVTKQVSKDQTVKFLFKLQDDALVESVLMSFNYGYSLCVTSQVGCNMGCKFCASGLLKKQRNLTAGEIVGQVVYVQKYLDEANKRLSNIVVMGTGEPFDNYQNVMNFCEIVNSDLGLAIGARKITISTCGLVDKIKLSSQEHKQYNLAISLHAANDELRSQLMPINNRYNIAELMASLDEYSKTNNRRLTFEYILLKGVNDSEQAAKELADLIRGKNAYVNLIPYNSVDENSFQGANEKQALRFYDSLMKKGIKCTLRVEHGSDIDGACGQLRAKYYDKGD